jgi:hypothetical protein
MTIAAISMFSPMRRKQALQSNQKSAHISYRGVHITHHRLEKRLTAFQKIRHLVEKLIEKLYALIAFLFSKSKISVNHSVLYVKKHSTCRKNVHARQTFDSEAPKTAIMVPRYIPGK